MSYIFRVGRYLRPYSKLAIGSVVVSILSSLASLLSPWPFKVLFDNVIGPYRLTGILASTLGSLGQDRLALLAIVIVAVLGIRVIDNGLMVLAKYLNSRIHYGMALDFQSDLFEHAQRLSLTYHDQRRSGVTLNAINFQSQAGPSLIMGVQSLGQSVLTLVGMFAVVLYIGHGLALLALLVVPLFYFSTDYYLRHIQHRLVAVRTLESESLSIIHEAMAMLRVIIAFGREVFEHRRFREQAERAVDARVRLTVRQALFSVVVNITTVTGTSVVLAFGAYQVLQGRLTVGQLVVLLSYVTMVYAPLAAISNTISSMQSQLVDVSFAFDLLDAEPEIRESPAAVKISRASGCVTLERVRFTYSGRAETLRDISFHAEPGQLIAIVGPSGAGKTTLVSLIPRFYDPQQGRVLLDGVDVRDLTLASLRNQISMVLQEPLLFSGTVAENIRFGHLTGSRDEVMEAARVANAHDFVMALPKGYETVIGERGASLSVGERQRIAIARAFIKNSPVLILDEPTSAVDSRTEVVILDALERLMSGRTTFIVAHRLSTIRSADTILVLNKGQVVEQGTQAELLREGGLFAQLFELQTAPGRSEATAELPQSPWT